MTPAAALALVCIGLVLMGLGCMAVRELRYANKGRRLVEAAGSEELAELAIGQVRDERLLREALLMRKAMKAYRGNVVRFVPRTVNHGRPMNFGPDGAA